ncbi:type VI secretion system tip protein VgrG [Pseudenhygromyxa sp. WMMC2535]|uniref:type VI secretion system Vgr family protein n=1 Tax=Pseudenhygromyxa sp. WMMC2535 TaxID=2712867 RepID=UPI0015527519|nr:type VI secretion system tip protein TssI/VgrG [Pseudenhygromyxa sp. WMMC2535]NVB38066.1 type VI secretion system tip protein VgrG [Pseudenhygromyxa sp. WMMC2535]
MTTPSPHGRLQPVLSELWMPNNPEVNWQVLSWRGREGIGAPYVYELELASEAPYDTCEEVIGANCELLCDRNGLVRVRYGVLDQLEIQMSSESRVEIAGVRAQARMVPAFKLLDQQIDTRFFAGKTVIQIVSELLGSALAVYGREVDVESCIKREYNRRDYCVQFRESTFAFCSRILEEEGVGYVFEANDDDQVERMVLVDNNEDYQEVDLLLPEPMPIVLNRGEQLDRESLHSFDWRSAKTPNRVVTRGYNRKLPGEVDEGSAEREDTHNPSTREAYHDAVLRQITDDPVDDPAAVSFTGGDLDQAGAQAAHIHAAHALEAERGGGRSNAIGFGAGKIFTLAEHHREALAFHEFLITAVRHEGGGEGGGEGEGGYSNSFDCVAREQTFVPQRNTPRPRVQGVQTGVVVGPALDEIHTDPQGRIKVEFHRDRYSSADEHASCWIPVVQSWAGNGFGAVIIPRVGMEVVVAFVDGNPDCPMVVGCVYNGTNTPPYELPAESTKTTFKTQSSPGGDGFNELRFEDAHGSEQIFMRAQRRMDLRVRGSLYETSYGNREERVGWESDGDSGGDHNTFVHKDVNHHVQEIRYTKIEKKQYETVVEDHLEEFQANHMIHVGETAQLSAAKVVVESSGVVSHKAGDVMLAGSSSVNLLGGGKVAIESNNAIELKVGGSFISITPGEIAIQGVSVRINSGGGVGSASDGETAEAIEMLDPLDALAASDAPGSGGGGGGRERSGRSVEPHHAPPMEPPPPPMPGNPTVRPDGTLRQFLTIEWVEDETWCSEPATLTGTTSGYTDGDTESADVRNASDGAVQRSVTLTVNSNAYTHNFDVVNLLPRKSGANYETERTLDATCLGQTTPEAIRLRFIPNLAREHCSIGRSHFDMEVVEYEVRMIGSITYVPGWINYVIQLGATVPAGTGGDVGLNFGNSPGSFTGSDWRYAKRTAAGLVYWNGTAWTAVPATWSDPSHILLYPIAVWNEGGTRHTQFGSLQWPEPIPAWGTTETNLASTTLPTWTTNINNMWTNKFDIKRRECRSTEAKCCRYKTKAVVTFTQTATLGDGIVLAANNARSNAKVWSLGDHRAGMPPHEFGHHLGNPDEYAGGVGVDASVNTDGATAGIDANSIMGANMITVKRRHYNTICLHLEAMVSNQLSRTYNYDAVPLV